MGILSILTINSIHQRIFKQSASKEMNHFIKDLSWSIFGGGISNIFAFILLVVVARILGPQNFGQYNSLLSFAAGISVIFLLGVNVGSIRFLSDTEYRLKQREIFTASLVLSLLQSVIVTIILLYLHYFVQVKLFSDLTFLLGLLFAFILSFKNLFDSYLRAFNFIVQQSFLRIAEILITFASFMVISFVIGEISYISLLIAFIIGSTCFIFYSAFILFNKLSRFTLKEVSLLINYNKVLIISLVGTFILSMDKFFIGKFIGIKELGVYSAYYSLSFLIMSTLGSILMNVFWPATIKNKESLKEIARKMRVLFIKVLPFWFIGISLFMTSMIPFFGRDYRFSIILIILFSQSSYSLLVYNVFLSFLSINSIKSSAVFVSISALILVSTILIFKDIKIYLFSQILIYGICSKIFFSKIILEKKGK